MTQTPTQTQEQINIEDDVQVASDLPKLGALILHNDDYTTMEFVVWVLVEVVHLPIEEAYDCMLAVHEEGRACACICPYEITQTYAHRITKLAEQHEYPLLVTVEIYN